MPTDRLRAGRLALALVLALALPGWGQDPLPAEQILALSNEADALIRQGEFDAAFAKLAVANDATFAQEYEALVKHYPNLIFARYFLALGNWADLQTYATSVASALDTDEFVAHPYRTEAVLLQGIAFYRQGETSKAEAPLRSAFRITRDDPALGGLHALATYYLAMLLTDLESPEAEEYRLHFFDLDLDGGPVTVEQTAYMGYRQVFESRLRGDDPAVLVESFEALLSSVEKQPGFNEIDMSFYRGFLGLLYAEAGRYDEALKLFEERHEWVLANDKPDDEFYWNVQRRAMLMSIQGDNEGAIRFLVAQIAFGKENGASPFLLGVLHRDVGRFSTELGRTAIGQMHYRTAYAEFRKTLRANDPEVLRIKALIDLSARDIASFAFAPELGVVGDVDYQLRADTADTVRLFFAGDYLVLDALLDGREEADGRTALFLVNRAMQQALVGEVADCLATLRRARTAVLLDPAGPVPPQAPMLDLIEGIAMIWSSANHREAARPILDRLAARLPILSDDERSLYLALEAFAVFQSGTTALIPDRFSAWEANWQTETDRGPLAIAAATLALEAGIGSIAGDRTATVRDATLADIDRQGHLELARDYVHMTDFLNSDTIFDEDALTGLGVLIRQIALRVPEDHSMVSASQFGMANALRWRGRLAEALDWLEQATTTLRSNPYAPSDTLAFLVSEMALVQAQLGQYPVAAALAREAYDMIDPMADRQDLTAAVIETYAFATWQRTGDAARAAAIYARHVDDPAYFDRLAPLHQVRLLRAYSDALSSTGDMTRIGPLLDRAEAALATELRDTRPDLSSVLWTRAIAEYFARDYATAFAHIRQANDLGKQWQDDQIANGAFSDIGAGESLNRAIWEAAIGWEYAQTLPE
jgi:tetratricopeptide (TPR) repeat protein